MISRAACIVQSGAVGDFILTLSIVQALRRAGYGPIRFIGRAQYATLVGGNNGIDAFESLDNPPWHRLFGDRPTPAVESMIRGGAPGLVLDMLGISAEALDALKSGGVSCIVRIDTRPAPGDHAHITSQWARSIRKSGIELIVEPPTLNHEIRSRIDRQVVIHVGSGGLEKCWALGNWLDVATRLKADGAQVLFPLGPSELERTDSAAVRDRLRTLGSIVESPSFNDLKALLAGTAAFCGNDSGITHLAAAMGVPTIAVFGATDPRVWRPLGSRTTCIGSIDGWPQVRDVLDELELVLSGGHRDRTDDA